MSHDKTERRSVEAEDSREAEEELSCSQLSPSYDSTLLRDSHHQVDGDILFRSSLLPTVSRSRSSAVAGRSVTVQSESVA